MKNQLKFLVAAAVATAAFSATVVHANEGSILLDGSSTVAPISEAVAEEFNNLITGNGLSAGIEPAEGYDYSEYADYSAVVGISGTGGGFKKFCPGETDISGASRPIKISEVELCDQSQTEYIALPVAYDALSVVVANGSATSSGAANFLVDAIEGGDIEGVSFDQLRSIWEPAADGEIMNWSQVEFGQAGSEIDGVDADFSLFAPGSDSGTFDFFTDKVNGEEGASRSDYSASEDDNTLVNGVRSSEAALGYFGYSYYDANAETLYALPISKTGEPGTFVAPSDETVKDGSYPLARPIYIYISADALAAGDDKAEALEAFVEFYMKNAGQLAVEVGYAALDDSVYEAALENFRNRVAGRYILNTEGEIVQQDAE